MTAYDWSELALVGAGVFGAAAIGASLISRRRLGRILYWVLAYIGVTCLALYGTAGGWQRTIGFTVFGIFVAVGYAFYATPFIKVGDRIFAAEVVNGRPDPADDEDPDVSPPSEVESYNGRHSAAATWWQMAVGSWLLAIGLVVTMWHPGLLIVVAFGSLVSGWFGYDDGARGFANARGHRLPFRIAAVGSLASAGIPLLCYFYGYRRGQLRPGYGKHDAVRQRRRRLKPDPDATGPDH